MQPHPEPTPLVVAVRDVLAGLALGPSRAAVAVSGGPDSLALLHLLTEAGPALGLELAVLHVDHGISPESSGVAARVAAVAAQLDVPYFAERLTLDAGISETQARTARWAALERLRRQAGADWIVTAHHLDDQAETVAMRALRGSGPAGLAGMALRDGHIIRPLLPFRRQELARYLRSVGLAAWDDPANREPRHDRSWIRNTLLPQLESRWPAVVTDLARAGADAGRWRQAWDAVLDQLPGLDLQLESDAISVAGGVLGDYDSPLGWAVARALARRAGAVISSGSAERMLRLARSGVSGRWVPLGNGWRASNAFGRLRIERPAAAPAAVVLRDDAGRLSWGAWEFRLAREAAPARQPRRALTAWFPPDVLSVRGPVAGERMRPLGGTGHRPLVRLLQAERVPQGRRDAWPVVVRAGEVVWMPGVCRSGAALPAPGEESLRIDAVHR